MRSSLTRLAPPFPWQLTSVTKFVAFVHGQLDIVAQSGVGGGDGLEVELSVRHRLHVSMGDGGDEVIGDSMRACTCTLRGTNRKVKLGVASADVHVLDAEFALPLPAKRCVSAD